MDTNERILFLIKEKGPVLPVHISKEIKENILMTSARLSELISSNKLKISSIKVGGSPLYYLHGQESRLQDFSSNLPGAEKRAYELLKQNKIIRESASDPAVRVAIRQLKDFAVPLQVTHEGQTEVFWRWYLIDNKDAEPLIKTTLAIKEKEEKKEVVREATNLLQQKELPAAPEPKLEKESVQKTIEPKIKEKNPNQIKKEPIKKIKPISEKKSISLGVNNFFNKNSITILETKEIKKNSELDYLVELKTSIGTIRYFCKAKNKKNLSEGDISSALLQAQSKNLPLLFLTTGTISKKAKDMLNTDFKNVVYKEI